jgi:hypothetical protein
LAQAQQQAVRLSLPFEFRINDTPAICWHPFARSFLLLIEYLQNKKEWDIFVSKFDVLLMVKAFKLIINNIKKEGEMERRVFDKFTNEKLGILTFRLTTLMLLHFCTFFCSAQKLDSFELESGVLLPIGKQIKSTYSIGLQISSGPRLKFKNFFITPRINLGMFSNQPQSSVIDNLLLYGFQTKVSYQIRVKKTLLEPFTGVGFMMGNNFITNKSSDFTGGYLSKKHNVLTLHGIDICLGVGFKATNKINIGLRYELFRPSVSLTQEALNALPSYQTYLYGNLIEFPSLKMNIDYSVIYFTFLL